MDFKKKDRRQPILGGKAIEQLSIIAIKIIGERASSRWIRALVAAILAALSQLTPQSDDDNAAMDVIAKSNVISVAPKAPDSPTQAVAPVAN